MSIKALQHELKTYYHPRSYNQMGRNDFTSPLWPIMDAFAAEHPDYSPVRLKAAMYEILAEHCQPVVFDNSPFYSETGLHVADCDGCPWSSTAGWLFRRNHHIFRDVEPVVHDKYINASTFGIHLSYGPYPDVDHHCCSYSHILEHGLEHSYLKAQEALTKCTSVEETEFVEAAITGLLAVRKIAEKFASAARTRLQQTLDPQQRRFMTMIAETAGRVPWQKAETFYEAICSLWFAHEIGTSMDGFRIYVLGHLDRLLGEFYRRDIAAGRITHDEAYDLLCRYLVYTDCKFADWDKNVDESYGRQELGSTIILGGCDAEGKTVCNEVTFMILKAHQELKLLYPKIHCRISKDSAQEYLDAINNSILTGRNVISFLNDDNIIPAQVKAGKRLADARCYVTGGCWEVIIEGCEHSAGANCYFNLARIVDMSIHHDEALENETGVVCDKIDNARSFDDVYRIVMENEIRAIRQMCDTIGRYGRVWPEVNPSPFFSACLADCLENRRDYTTGSARYNPHGLPLTNFAVLVDSLLAIKHLCFDSSRHSLDELLAAVRANWEGFEVLRAEALTSRHFGDNSQESKALSRQIIDEIHARTRDLVNERGGPFQIGLYSYRDIVDWAKLTRATPDGRKAGDFLSQGLTPSRLRHSDITSVINSAGAIDLTLCPANSVLTVSLPLGKMNMVSLAGLERAFAAAGIGYLQMSCVDKEELLDAIANPQNHKDLVVRLYGYSARFINLSPEMQKEFLSRIIYE